MRGTSEFVRRTLTLQLEPIVTLPWLVRLRWAFLAGQCVLLPVAGLLFHMTLVPVLIGIELGVMSLSNLVLSRMQHRMLWSRAHAIGAVMILDTVLLTLLLAGSGGAANPFTVLYLVHITLSAIVLSSRWVATIAGASLGGFALLFTTSDPHAMMHHGTSAFSQHLQIMFIAFALAAVLIAFFVGKVTREIGAQRDQIARLRETSERNERLASVIRLAAGAAHELGSPLATIAVAAHEARRRVSGEPDAIVADLDLIALEVDRCREILSRMASREAREDNCPLTLLQLADAIRDELGEDASLRVDIAIAKPATFSAPRDQIVQSIVALVDNSLEATTERVRVELGSIPEERSIEIVVADRGDVLSAAVLAQIGSPFFTTKESGRGLGLGVFLARAFCESRGGRLTITSERGCGTRAAITLPQEAR